MITYVELKGNTHGGDRKSKDRYGLLNLEEIAQKQRPSAFVPVVYHLWNVEQKSFAFFIEKA